VLHAILSCVEMDIIIASPQDDATAPKRYPPETRNWQAACDSPEETQSISRRDTDPSDQDLDMLDHGMCEPSIHTESWPSEPDHSNLAEDNRDRDVHDTPYKQMCAIDVESLPADIRLPCDLNLQQTIPTIDATTERLEGIWKAVELVLSTAFCGRPKRLSKGYSFTQRTIQPLVVVAPFVWCPRTLPWLADRTPFLPTIACALTGVMSHRHQSLSTYTSQRFFETLTPNLHDNERWRSPQSQSFRGHLWKLLQGQAVRSPPASFGLLKEERDTAQEEVDSQDDILDAHLDHNAIVAFEAGATVPDLVCGESNEWSDDDLLGSWSGMNCCEPFDSETADQLTHESLYSLSQSTIDTRNSEQLTETMTHYTSDEKPTDCSFPDMDHTSICSSLEMLSLPDIEAHDDPEGHALQFGDITIEPGENSAMWA
jgi:hypothetical protein